MARPSQPECWRSTIDGWVRDADIRRAALIALAMVLAAVVLVAGVLVAGVLVAGAAGGTIATLTQTALPTPLAKMIAGGACATAGTGAIIYRRWRARRARPAQ